MNEATSPQVREVVIIKSRATDGTAGMGHAIFAAVKKDQVVVVQAVGAGAVNKAVKGIAFAGQILGREGVALVCDISFQTGEPSAGHTEPVSMIAIRVDTKELS